MDKITTTIKREWLREIVAGRKRVEYREIKPYWSRRLAGVETPFLLRLISGMHANAPEVTVIVTKVVRNGRMGSFELHISRVIGVRHWDRRRECPSRGDSGRHLPRVAKEQQVTDYCVYTIVDGKTLARKARDHGPVEFEERKKWVTGRMLWLRSRSANRPLRMPVLFGDACDCSRLLYWGVLTKVLVRDRGTRFVVDHLRKIRGRHSPQELVLRRTRQNIAEGFIRPYALCVTPKFVA